MHLVSVPTGPFLASNEKKEEKIIKNFLEEKPLKT